MTSALIHMSATIRAGMNETERQQPNIDIVIIHTLAALFKAASKEPETPDEAQESRYVRRFLNRHLME